MQTFEFREMVEILQMSPAKAKNWIVGRPFTIEASIRTASGHGSRNLYSLEDVYLMGVANELSHSGMAAAAIGKFIAALHKKFPDGLAGVETLCVVRGEELTYRIELREERLPADSVVRFSIDVAKLRRKIDLAAKKLQRG
jgi:DNA-binding transcriptional MerR regulator